MAFNFAHLLPGAKAAAKATADPAAMEDEEDPAAMEDEEEYAETSTAEDEQDPPEAAEDGEEDEEDAPSAKTAAAAYAKGVKAGARAENRRCVGILAAAAPHTVAQAATMIAEGVPLKSAKAALAAAPKGGGSLAAAMKGRDAPTPTAGGDAGSDLPPELKAAQASLMAKRSR